ncbi:MBL fold metallo-hydrolase [Nocardia vaccinii]|uniref:MBL fold metallo-hydrolase n=1 Tax=Nocardia vaccinii TaxID=1822 RepID=UPI00082BF528|nr:MBL fold metallo-hydrolase [Nocardia vaccinii]
MTQLVGQPDDWTEPGAFQVTPGVHRIPLPLPLNGLAAVNAYLLEGEQGLIFIDPGWAGSDNERAVTAALRELGFRLDDITLCLATHHHWDHYSQAFAWRTSLGSKLLTGAEEHHSIEEAINGADTGRFPNHARLMLRCGAPDLARNLAESPAPPEEDGIEFGIPDGWLSGGDSVALREGALEVVATPGHTRGHVVFHHSDAGVLFSGDHILPTITPSVGFEWTPEPQPLRSFLKSLQLILGRPDAAVLPSHGPVTTSAHARVRELLEHHQQRLDEVCDEIAGGAATAYQVARALPWTRRARRLDELPLEHQMSAIAEIDAHLDVLSLLGRLAHDDADTDRRYALAGRS